jgi:glycosyltransferase involved in cell wall biosynthesis
VQKPFYPARNGYFFYKTFTARFIKKSSAIVTLSQYIQEELAVRFKVQEQAIKTIGSGIDASFKPLKWEEREVIKERFAEGYEYFVFLGGLHTKANFLSVLKAFSIFKKWQKSGMKLIIVRNAYEGFEKELERLSSYKFRSEVFIKKDLSKIDKAAIVGASYALIFPSYYPGFPVPVLKAIQSGVPVIASNNSSICEIAAEAVLYIDPAKPEEIAEQMKRIFKDEQLRNKLIEAGKLRSKLFSWDKTAALLWQVIEQTV